MIGRVEDGRRSPMAASARQTRNGVPLQQPSPSETLGEIFAIESILARTERLHHVRFFVSNQAG